MKGIEFTPEHPPDELADLAALAEAEGFEAAFASSHYFNRDPFVTLSRMAAATEEIRLGPGVVNPYESHPATLAARVATVAEVSDGRALLGLGAGDRSALAALGIDRDRPLRRVLETMDVVRDLWQGKTVSREGTFEVREASLNTPSAAIPVYVGAQGPDMLRMAAKHADGVLVNASHPDDLAWAEERLEEGRAERGRDGEFEALSWASVSVAEDRDDAREAARPPVAFIAADVAEPVLERHGIAGEDARSVGEALEAGEFSTAFERVTPAMLDAFSIAGTPREVEERFEAVLEHVDGIVVGSPLGPDLGRGVELAGEALARATRD
ncbi:5,10-methylenetetrahydromethanopterin reductase [Saliphagus infecundisoli]|uniref:5,10-methylenetetrahydromethanopterin reductase n=1 Tax=Saliphagus infecundisoli TaxID=1849069 RepID=A0ABD5QH11_9EURY|nr:5,10-methylenetetrahydromethanopterin reductase [Saliphagus infecundisoli]